MFKIFQPQEIEKKWYDKWESSKCFTPTNNSDDSFCIILPPPNITGSLHMGHAFQDSIMDALTRYNRMLGKDTLWQPGTDHASISTQMVVERQLQAQGKNKYDMGREAFLEKVWEWKEESGNTITSQMRRLGTSTDWERERFTMDPEISEVVADTFVELYREGLIYRGQKLVNWDPVMQTAISDLEVISTDENGSLWYFRYPVTGTSDFITIATTRPETLLGDTAVAVNPDDDRYSKYIGKTIDLPLTDRKIPIIADDYVDKEFGTGCVKITPAHDFNDNEIGKRHKLPLINILTKDAKINESAPSKYQGLDRFEARKAVIADMDNLGLLEKVEPHALKVPRGEKSNTVIEPLLTDQWFVKIEDLAKPAIDVVKNGKIKFIPENWSNTYYEWMNNIQDWCISRQIWWGHRIPAWFDESGNVFVGKTEDDVRNNYNLNSDVALTQDNDVLDTWFSSALWPFTSLDWPHKKELVDKFFPTSVLVTGFDIIFFWVARMIMMSLKLTGEIPFKEIYIHGLIQDQDGQKMSKSKGNVLDPIDLIDGVTLDALIQKRTSGLMQPHMKDKIIKTTKKQFPEGIPAFGTDALRFTFYSLATHGRHICFDLQRTEGYRNFCNKLWNGARYINMNTEGELPEYEPGKASVVDAWIISIWQDTKEQIANYFNNYRFDLLASTLYEFVWHKFCDWYLELTKPILNGDNVEHKLQTKKTMKFLLNEVIAAMHPLTPFITEEIWHLINTDKSENEYLMLEGYPVKEASLINERAVKAVETLIGLVQNLRNIRGEVNVSPSKEVELLLQGDNNKSPLSSLVQEHKDLVLKLAKLSSITWIDDNQKDVPVCASTFYCDTKLLVPLQGLVDKNVESQRLTREISKLDKELQKIKGKLENPNYKNKAPQEIVLAEEKKLEDLEVKHNKLKESLALLETI